MINTCPNCAKLKIWAESAWMRGHQQGLRTTHQSLLNMEKILEQAKKDSNWENSMLTEALLKAEEERDYWKARFENGK